MFPLSPRRPRGFTLMEILIVLLIIGVLSAIAFPNIDINRYRAESAMQGVGTTLMVAQRLAVTQQHNVIVRFDEATHAIILHEDTNNDGTVNGQERRRRIPLGEQIRFGLGSAPAHTMSAQPIDFTKIIDDMPAVIFRRNGSASEHGTFYITTQRAVLNGGHPGDTRLLEVERSTGRTSWYRYKTSGWTRGF